MTAASPETMAWLLAGAQQHRTVGTIVMLRVGGTAHVVRCPSALAAPVLTRLLEEDPDGAGPVLEHPYSHVAYVWVRPGSSASYPDGCRLLDRPAWIPAPAPDRECGVARWLYVPPTPRLTSPVWLAAALAECGVAQAAVAAAPRERGRSRR